MSFALATTALASIGPIARTSELRARGVTKREIGRAHKAGEILQVRQGLYAAIDASDDLVHAAMHGGAPACLPAGQKHGLWMLETERTDESLHVWLGHAGERHACDRPNCEDTVRVHWDDGTALPGRLPPVRNALLQIAVCMGEEPFFVALESALRHSLLPPDGLPWLGERVPEPLRWLLMFARTDADSGLESLIRLRLHHLGIPVKAQVLINGVGEVDFVIGDRLIIEADGRENHEREAMRHKDLVRDAKSASLGYETLRFDYAMIVHDWETVEAAIVAKVAAGAHMRSSFDVVAS